MQLTMITKNPVFCHFGLIRKLMWPYVSFPQYVNLIHWYNSKITSHALNHWNDNIVNQLLFPELASQHSSTSWHGDASGGKGRSEGRRLVDGRNRGNVLRSCRYWRTHQTDWIRSQHGNFSLVLMVTRSWNLKNVKKRIKKNKNQTGPLTLGRTTHILNTKKNCGKKLD